ncbi:MAG: lipoprotein [Paucimonas sp.]|nr:lipoprotein [Paucimonas sp.]
MKSKKSIFLCTALAILLTGCATKSELYSWGNYEDQLYAHFKGEAPEKHILAMESMLEQAKAGNAKVPPGFYAHLGMLYERAGKADEARHMLNMEKQAFPESARYIDNLNNQFKKASTQ